MATWWPEPKPGDIVECRFPQDKVPGPGPKERPSLITKVEIFEDANTEKHAIIEVAYGTSQDTHDVHPGEFVVKKQHPNSGLTKDTKFDLGNVFKLPFDDEWFAPAALPDSNVPPKRGNLDPVNDQIIKRKIGSAVLEAKKHGRLKTKKPKLS